MSYNDVRLDERFDRMVDNCIAANNIDLSLFLEYDVKRGLRDFNGKGVLTGLTEISDVVAYSIANGEKRPIDGELYYQGYPVQDMVKGFENRRFGFEEITYTLLFGKLPTQEQLDDFVDILGDMRDLPDTFVRDVVMKAPSPNMMNTLQKCVLTLYSYDERPDDISVRNVLRQSMQLIAQFPLITVYGYHTYRHFLLNRSLVIRNPRKELSTAENILLLLRSDGKYSDLEARVLDVALVLHAEHGGGNNSTFTNRVVSSSGTDTYSAVAASLGSLKGPKHGGANLKVQEMLEDIKANVSDWENEDELHEYLQKILHREAFDRTGLIYGMGHAVYTESDPREVILKEYAQKLSVEKNRAEEYALYDRVERIAKDCITDGRRIHKPVCANVDFYSGFVYNMLDLPRELYTPIFAISRIAGWSAHRIEELANGAKIMRPAYKYVGKHRPYVSMDSREETYRREAMKDFE